jgi:hypothetical protein
MTFLKSSHVFDIDGVHYELVVSEANYAMIFRGHNREMVYAGPGPDEDFGMDAAVFILINKNLI